jgi:CxxC motif-containing protein (DUF1111 family)
MRTREARFRIRWSDKAGPALVVAAVLGACGASAGASIPATQRVEEGRELFLREWIPGDSRSHGGDGLGPVYNDSSCVACHNAGGPGGGGPTSKNVDIISASPIGMPRRVEAAEPAGFLSQAFTALTGVDAPQQARPAPPSRPDNRELIRAHAGFRTARSVVLHRFGVDPGYEGWRQGMTGAAQFMNPSPLPGLPRFNKAQAEIDQIKMFSQRGDLMRAQRAQIPIGNFFVLRSQRNPTALFGAGLIDAIPDAVLEAAADRKHPDRPEIAGRVSRQKDGRIGRFGWKAQTPSLDDFVRTACAVELGLDVPGHHQAGLPQKPEAKPAGLDLSDDQCNALLAYVASLPKPAEIMPASPAERQKVGAGKVAFERAGCSACHRRKLGDVEGIYSDLLLHDMGPETGDTGAYGAFVPDPNEPDVLDSEEPAAVSIEVASVTVETGPGNVKRAANAVKRSGPATRQEWRTPPLWGFRDSGPYLHDGRAATLDEAIALHGGEAAGSARDYFALRPAERQQIAAFLKALVAPLD